MSEHIQYLIEAMQKSEAYSHPTSEEIKVIHTAISVVFLTGKFAYKISKPVNFGFLDFSTLDRRKKCYDKEVEFNKLISPELYHGVVNIVQNENGNIKVDSSDDNVIEYAIKMKQCDQNNVMKELLKLNKVNSEQINDLANTIYTFHKKAPVSEEISSFGKMKTVKGNWDENFEQTQNAKEKMISSENFAYIQEKVEKFLQNNNELIGKRVEKGNIKHCHGDLHSGNVFIENGQIIIFDGIVFNKRFPNSDTISDLAFMLMDLEFLGFNKFSELLLNKYQEKMQDEDMKILLPFYKCYRAYVKGKINFFVSNDDNVPEKAKINIIDEGKKYFELARKYAEEM